MYVFRVAQLVMFPLNADLKILNSFHKLIKTHKRTFGTY